MEPYSQKGVGVCVEQRQLTGKRELTEKPVELAVRAIEYSSRPGENVLDLFGGSGSTLIAAEQTGRRAFLMELDRQLQNTRAHRRGTAPGCRR